ncbi:hypothetical protein BDZ91DRAFT_763372 [Kalaharituber pfeilii]|nr:hypothetical protein BDZ91DRAFT_763372 [Kalaharituber pfeilii]
MVTWGVEGNTPEEEVEQLMFGVPGTGSKVRPMGTACSGLVQFALCTEAFHPSAIPLPTIMYGDGLGSQHAGNVGADRAVRTSVCTCTQEFEIGKLEMRLLMVQRPNDGSCFGVERWGLVQFGIISLLHSIECCQRLTQPIVMAAATCKYHMHWPFFPLRRTILCILLLSLALKADGWQQLSGIQIDVGYVWIYSAYMVLPAAD